MKRRIGIRRQSVARDQLLGVFGQFALDIAPGEVEALGTVPHPEQFDQHPHEHLVEAQGFQRMAAREFLVHEHRVDRHRATYLFEHDAGGVLPAPLRRPAAP